MFVVAVCKSLHHALDHLGLNRAVSEVLSIEVLRLVSHTVATVANDWDFYLGFIRHLGLLLRLGRVHGDLIASRHPLEAVLSAGVPH